MALVGYSSDEEEEGVGISKSPRQDEAYNTAIPESARQIGSDTTAPQQTPTETAESQSEPEDDPSDPAVNPGRLSPYSFSRTQVRNKTMPLFPCFDIPPSPPGSPDRAIETRFRQFLNLKQDIGINEQSRHFNLRLVKTPQLLNPAMEVNPLEQTAVSVHDTYDSALPPDLAVPAASAWPEWAFVDQLVVAQERMRGATAAQAARDKGKKPAEFVPARKGRFL